jgi:hypothetical protein
VLSKFRYSASLYLSLLCLTVCSCLGLFVAKTWHWPLVGDAPLIHYVVFLANHGLVPYRNIIDPNMPGTYCIEALVTHFFGFGALPWRIFDLLLTAVAAACMLQIAAPHGLAAGFIAAGTLTLIHGRDGFIELGQRDLVLAVFALLAYSFLFALLRKPRSGWIDALLSAAFGLFLALATTIKPTAALFFPPLLALGAVVLRNQSRSVSRFLAAALAAAALPPLLILIALLRARDLQAFLAILDQLIPYHARLLGLSMSYMALHVLSSVLLPIVLLWLPVGLTLRRWSSWEGAALLIGFLVGAVSFCVQRRAYPYHRYPSEAFLLLWIALDLVEALRNRSLNRGKLTQITAALALFYGVFVIAVGSTALAIRYDWRNQDFQSMLRADLTQLGGPSLSGQVQCLDMANGCIDALLRMKLVQDTGFLYDCYLYGPPNDPEEQRYRRQFWNAITARPPKVFIVTSFECRTQSDYHYSKLQRWQPLRDLLRSQYRLYADRIPPRPVRWSRSAVPPTGYRIYLRK